MKNEIIITIIILTTIRMISQLITNRYKIDYLKKTNKRISDLDKGELGEFNIAKELNKIKEKKDAFFNVYYLNKNNSTEVDIVFICKSGIYVIESKNYQGKISGNWNDREWTQTTSRGFYPFYNPVMQNNTHVRRVIDNLPSYNDKQIPVYSLVVFPNNIKMTLDNKTAHLIDVCKIKDIRKIIKRNEKTLNSENLLTNKEIDMLGIHFHPKTIVDDIDKLRHINYARKKSTQRQYS